MYIPLTFKHYQQRIKAQHGDEWPKYVLARYAALKECIEVHEASTGDTIHEFKVIEEWLLNIIEAGIAFQQTKVAF